MKYFIIAVTMIIAASTTATAKQFHETEFYKTEYMKLSKLNKIQLGLKYYIDHVYQNILSDHRNKVCEHRRDVDLDLVKINFRYKSHFRQTHHPHYARSIKQLAALKVQIYKNCYQKNAKVVNDDWSYSDVEAEPTNDAASLPSLSK